MAAQPSAQAESKKRLGRPWEVIATELCEEKDNDKIIVLSEELNRALDRESIPEK